MVIVDWHLLVAVISAVASIVAVLLVSYQILRDKIAYSCKSCGHRAQNHDLDPDGSSARVPDFVSINCQYLCRCFVLRNVDLCNLLRADAIDDFIPLPNPAFGTAADVLLYGPPWAKKIMKKYFDRMPKIRSSR